MTRVEQGPQAGRQHPLEATEYTDDETGATVHKLTDARGHDHHLYFTNPGWYDDGRKLLFSSDRTRRPNLYSIDLETRGITQLTDLPPLPEPEGRRGSYSFPFLPTSVNPERPEAYFWQEEALVAIDLDSLSLRVLWESPDGYDSSMTNVTADGAYVCTSITERPDVDREAGYGGFEETWAARPESKVVAVPVDAGGAEVLHEEDYWIGHVNTSPARPELLTFCHEGPWEKVDNRIWGLNREAGETWPIRERREDEERVGHEFWLADGETVGYHGTTADGTPLFGFVRYDGTGRVDGTPIGSHHFHSNTRELIVGDGSSEFPYLVVWRFDPETETFHGPRKLAHHGCSAHHNGTHVHPQVGPDDERVLFTPDRSAYANLYVADLPAFGDLPEVDLDAYL
jgi:oligogalacturonide lyase